MDGFINRFLIFIAKKLKVSPLIAHLIVAVCVSIAYGFASPTGFRDFQDPFFQKLWLGIWVIVIGLTWVTKGELRSAWSKAKPWQDD